MKKKIFFSLAVSMLIMLVLASAQELALDIETDKLSYSAGENVSYTVRLLKDRVPYSAITKVFISDKSSTFNSFSFDVNSNEKRTDFLIKKDFPSGYWKIKTSYQEKVAERYFLIGDREEVEFSINEDKLVIKNTGNVRYTKTVRILIGDKEITQKQDIDIGQDKEIKLVAPEGNYNVQVSDGINSISKQDVHLVGTGRVIGALDEQIAESQPALGGARDTSSESFFTGNNFTVAFIFIGAVFGLFILLAIERTMHKKRASRAKDMVGLH